MRPTYSLTFDVVTPESAAAGDCAEFGFEREPIELGREFGLADAIREARRNGCASRDAEIHAPMGRASFYSADGETDYRTGAETRRCAHFSGMTESTLRRIARALVR